MSTKSMSIVLPSGRIQEPVVTLLRDAGISLHFGHDKRSLFPSGAPEGFAFVVLRPEDAAGMMRRGEVQAAFLGADMIEELGVNDFADTRLVTGLNRVRLCAAVPHEDLLTIKADMKQQKRLRVATKFPRCAANWATEYRVNLDIFPVRGSVEAFTRLGYDMIVDVVDSGQTLTANALTVLAEIKSTSTCLVVNKTVNGEQRFADLLYSLTGVLNARSRVLLDVNVADENKARVLQVLKPEALSSVNEFRASDGSWTLHCAIQASRRFEIIRQARQAGAHNELVTPVIHLGQN